MVSPIHAASSDLLADTNGSMPITQRAQAAPGSRSASVFHQQRIFLP
jgi:hypothetical protein